MTRSYPPDSRRGICLLRPLLVCSNQVGYIDAAIAYRCFMFHAGAILDFKRKFLKSLLPSSLLAHHFWNLLQPRESSMVSSYLELSSQQILFEQLYKVHDRQQLLPRRAVVDLCLAICPTIIGYNPFLSRLNLRQYCSDRIIASIHIQHIHLLGGWHCQDWRAHHRRLQGVESCMACRRPWNTKPLPVNLCSGAAISAKSFTNLR